MIYKGALVYNNERDTCVKFTFWLVEKLVNFLQDLSGGA